MTYKSCKGQAKKQVMWTTDDGIKHLLKQQNYYIRLKESEQKRKSGVVSEDAYTQEETLFGELTFSSTGNDSRWSKDWISQKSVAEVTKKVKCLAASAV